MRLEVQYLAFWPADATSSPEKGAQKKRVLAASRFSCPGWDSNPHALNGHMALNHACLPISAPGRCKA